jgi:hypothetical protein
MVIDGIISHNKHIVDKIIANKKDLNEILKTLDKTMV